MYCYGKTRYKIVLLFTNIQGNNVKVNFHWFAASVERQQGSAESPSSHPPSRPPL